MQQRLPSTAIGLGLVCCALAGWGLSSASASKLILKDGRLLDGGVAQVGGTVEDLQRATPAGAATSRPVVLVDDGLRRTFVSRQMIQEVAETAPGDPPEKFNVYQDVAKLGARVTMAGPIVRTTPFDDYGRRILEMLTNEGMVPIIQGITEVTPEWIKVEALDIEGRNYVWDMRLATSSLPRATLGHVLARQIDPKNIDHRLKLVRLYLQSERFKDAEDELAQIVADFPDHKQQFEPTRISLHQAYARRILNEIEFRRDAGQHNLAYTMLEQFPAEDVAGETLQAVRKMLDDYGAQLQRGKGAVEKLDALLAEITDSALRARVAPAVEEIKLELNLNTLPRMAAFRQFADSETLTGQEKLALGISGWLIGSDSAVRNLPVALSLYEVRNLTSKYLVESLQLRREETLAELRKQEGATPEQVAKLLAHMKPPVVTEAQENGTPGLYELSVDGLKEQAPIVYLVQLPPEYDPYRKYPCVVTLHGAGSTPQQQIDWWAGSADEQGQRLGQAGRHGYIVLAPYWAAEHQKQYQYGVEEHAAVLNSLRDACRRFSIDTDRVFLSGHSMGGDAAWDLGLAHPDLWAGVIPVTATADRYVAQYWKNAENMPLYFITGELDGNKAQLNARDLDRYLRGGFNCTVVEYLGRGHEHFSDEIVRLFDWMKRYRRDFYPKELEARSMRHWDNYFYWVELAELPERSLVDPQRWPPPRNTVPVTTVAQVNQGNGLNVTTGAGQVTVWLSPQLIDFKRPTSITVKGARLRTSEPYIEPSVAVMLEDARTRADRLNPFWAKVVMPEGVVNGAR